MTTGKIIALNIQTFVNKVMSLLFNMLSRFVIAFSSSKLRLLNIPLKQQVVFEGAKTEDWGNNLSTIVKSRGKILSNCSRNRSERKKKQSSYM